MYVQILSHPLARGWILGKFQVPGTKFQTSLNTRLVFLFAFIGNNRFLKFGFMICFGFSASNFSLFHIHYLN